MKNQNDAENELRSATRRYLCNIHLGAEELVQLSNVIQQTKEKGILTESRMYEVIDEVLSTPPGYKDRQDLEVTIAVKLMRFQHATNRKINGVDVVSTTYENSNFPIWSVKILLDKEDIL